MTIPQLWLDHFPASAWGVTVDAKDAGQLVRPLRDAYWTIRTHAHERGLRCEVASAYRTPYQQYRLRLGRVPAGHEFDPAYGGSPPTALPGRSHHQSREALDLDMTGGGFDWLEDSGELLEVGCEQTVDGERWHIEATRTPRGTLIPYPGAAYDDDDQEVDDMPLTESEIKRIALITAATTEKVLLDNFAQLQNALGLPVIAGVDRVLGDNFDELAQLIEQVKDRLDHDHGPA